MEEEMSGECDTYEKKRNKYRVLVRKLERRADFLKNALIYNAFCLATGPQPLTKAVLQTACANASSFKFQYPLSSFRSSSSCLCLLPSRLLLHIEGMIIMKRILKK
jgi:hypothetical protein